MPEAGRIKIGKTVPAKTKDGKDYARPVSLDHFVATGTYAERFRQQFGDEPNMLTIVFISDDFKEVCNQRFDCWEGGKHFGWGDGEDFSIWDKNAYVQVKKDSPLLKGHEWKERLTLRFLLPDMKGIVAYWTFETGGAKSTIPSIIKCFDFVKDNAGTIRGVPFQMHVEKAKGYTPGEARQYSRVKIIPVITVENFEKLRDFMDSGRSLTEIAPILLNESKLGRIEAPVIDIPSEVVESKTK